MALSNFKPIALTLLAVCMTLLAFAQTPVVRGSDKQIRKTLPLSGFNQVQLKEINGKVIVEAGPSHGVSIEVNDNLLSYFQASEAGGVLTIAQVPNVYLEELNLVIRIQAPRLEQVKMEGNADLHVSGINNQTFTLTAEGNGKVLLSGRTDRLMLSHEGNGHTDARGLKAGQAELSNTGNGDMLVAVNGLMQASVDGNGNILNYGEGKARNSTRNGNGKIETVTPARNAKSRR